METPAPWGELYFHGTLFQSFPRKGMETRCRSADVRPGRLLFQSFPRKGMETRGQHGLTLKGIHDQRLFQSFPRKGMETFQSFVLVTTQVQFNLFQSFPRKGMETQKAIFHATYLITTLFQSFPRKGMETLICVLRRRRGWRRRVAFSIISPQGDGNSQVVLGLADSPALFQSFPRKGMETVVSTSTAVSSSSPPFSIISPQGDGNKIHNSVWVAENQNFFNHFPARGWKLLEPGTNRPRRLFCFFNHFPARGWKLEAAALTEMAKLSFSIISPQGDGNDISDSTSANTASGFFNHFPARGWKRHTRMGCHRETVAFSIISPQGDGNRLHPQFSRFSGKPFSIISPQGDGNNRSDFGHLTVWMLFQSFPRKGMETFWNVEDYLDIFLVGYERTTFSIISPQGDGNANLHRTDRSFRRVQTFSIISPQGDGN